MSSIKEKFVGSWKLKSSEFQSSNGEVQYPLGKDAIGILMYDATGSMSVQLMKKERPIFESGDIYNGTPSEIKAAFEGILTYFGMFEIDESKNVITHHVSNSSFPNMKGTSQTRYFEFSNNVLKLKAPPMIFGSKEIKALLIWERVGLLTG